MRFKEKLVGILLIIIGALPLLLKIKSVADSFAKYALLSWMAPGEFVYQMIIILLGVILVWENRYSRFRRY
jgi:hypothetical protein